MTNLEDNYELVECDEMTANNCLAMAEMEEEIGDQMDADVEADDMANIMQFSAYNINANQNQGM